MKKNFAIIILLLFMFAGSTFSQNKLALNLGYDYMQKHSGFLGAEYRLNNAATSLGSLNVGIGSYIYGNDGKFSVAPEIHFNKTWSQFIITEISTSTKNIKPSVGVSFFNLARLQFGYSFPLGQSGFKGFSVGFHILIGRSPFYDEIKVF